VLRVVRAELHKLRRARVVSWTLVAVAGFASMTAWGSAVWAPDAPVTWVGVLTSGTMWAAGWWGVLVFSLATAHLFGAEYGDGTAASMLTTPICRAGFVVAKLIVLAAWVLTLTLISVGAHAAIAAAQSAQGFTWAILCQNLSDSLLVALLIYLTLPSVACVSVAGRGYVAPMLYASGMMAIGWTFGFLGWAAWFPWSMPATVVGGMGPPGITEATLGPGSWAIIGGLFAAGVLAVFAYVNTADVGV